MTTDSVLQLYHIFYDYLSRNLWRRNFISTTPIWLNSSNDRQLSAHYQVVQNEEVKDAVLKMLVISALQTLSWVRAPADLPA